MASFFPSDDALPTWLHTLACFGVVAVFGAPLIWWGVEAIYLRHLEPLSGPEIGQYFFGPAALQGRAAVRAGWSLVAFGACFFALGAGHTRAGKNMAVLRLLPWALLAVSAVLGLGITTGHSG